MTNQSGGMDDELRSGGGGGGALILALIGWVWQHRVHVCNDNSLFMAGEQVVGDRGPRAEGEGERHTKVDRLIVSQAEKQIHVLCAVYIRLDDAVGPWKCLEAIL